MTGYPVRLAVVCATLILGLYTLRLSLLHTRDFDPDEFQHVHAAWAVHEGLLPFRDFFEHHMPGMQIMLAPTFAGFRVASSVDDAIRFLFFARTLMWVFAGASLVITVLIGTRFGGPAVGWLSGGLLSTSVVFLSRTLEIRPDTPGLAMWLASLLFLSIAVSRDHADGRRRWYFIAGGFWLGFALVFNQKLLLAGPGLLFFGVQYLFHESPRRRRGAVLDLVSFAGASATPLVALFAFFWRLGAGGELIAGVLTTNLGWPREVSPGTTLNWMLLRDPLLMGVAVAGAMQASFEAMNRRRVLPTAVLLLPAISLLAGLFVIPTPYPQYMLPVLPVGAVLGARFIWMLCDAEHFSREGRLAGLVVVLSGVGVTLIGLVVARPFFIHPAVYPTFGVVTIASALVLVFRRQPDWAAAVLLCACSAYAIQQVRWMQGLSNANALRDMRSIHAMTAPTDRILDGFSGLSWFRPHASFYPFLHSGVRNHLSPEEKSSLGRLLDECDQRPKLVIFDEQLKAVSPAFAPLLERYYRPLPSTLIWLRNDAMCGTHSSDRTEGVR
jgi:dolichyl-phosphate-mannose-protein mannosyltransferase